MSLTCAKSFQWKRLAWDWWGRRWWQMFPLLAGKPTCDLLGVWTEHIKQLGLRAVELALSSEMLPCDGPLRYIDHQGGIRWDGSLYIVKKLLWWAQTWLASVKGIALLSLYNSHTVHCAPGTCWTKSAAPAPRSGVPDPGKIWQSTEQDRTLVCHSCIC